MMDVHIPCPCPGTPHPDGDTVTLRDKPSLRMGTTALGWASTATGNGRPAAADIAEVFLREGIVDWTFTLEDGEPRPLDDEGLAWLLDDYSVAYPIAEEASALYTNAIFDPLLERAKEPRKSSPTSRTSASTSVNSRRSQRARSG